MPVAEVDQRPELVQRGAEPRLGQESVGIYVYVDEEVDAVCERARSAGAQITEEPTDQEYGERRFTAEDLEGHVWYFARPIKQVAPEEWGAQVAS